MLAADEWSRDGCLNTFRGCAVGRSPIQFWAADRLSASG